MSKETRPDFTHKWASGGTVVAPTTAKVDLGWVKEKPTQEYWNYLENRQDQAIAYLYQQGVPEWDSTIEYQAGSSWITYAGKMYKSTQTGTNKNPATQTAYWAKVEHGVNVKDYGAIGNNSANDSTAFTNAIASAAATGGLVIIPTDNGEVYRVNLTILTSGITLQGTNRSRENGSSVAGLRPYNDADPVITIGDDSTTVTGVTLEGLVFTGDAGGTKGLSILGGVSHCHFNGCAFLDFTTYQISINPAATKNVSYMYFDSLSMNSSKTGSNMIFVDAGKNDANTYATAIYFDNIDIRTPTTGTAVYNKEGNLNFSNGWIQCNDNGAGTAALAFYMTKDASTPIRVPNCILNNVSIDSTSSSHTLIEINEVSFVSGTSAVISNYIRGSYTVDGKVKDYTGAVDDILRNNYHFQHRPASYAGTLIGTTVIASADTPTTTQASFYAASGLMVINTTSGLNLATGGVIQVGGTRVVGTRMTGWGAPSGTFLRSTLNTYTAPTISASYTQSEVQAMADHIQVLSRTLAALIADCRSHGLIGT